MYSYDVFFFSPGAASSIEWKQLLEIESYMGGKLKEESIFQ